MSEDSMGLPFMSGGVNGWNGLLLPMVPPCGWDFIYSDRNLAQIEATATATRSSRSLHFVIPNYNPAQPTNTDDSPPRSSKCCQRSPGLCPTPLLTVSNPPLACPLLKSHTAFCFLDGSLRWRFGFGAAHIIMGRRAPLSSLWPSPPPPPPLKTCFRDRLALARSPFPHWRRGHSEGPEWMSPVTAP